MYKKHLREWCKFSMIAFPVMVALNVYIYSAYLDIEENSGSYISIFNTVIKIPQKYMLYARGDKSIVANGDLTYTAGGKTLLIIGHDMKHGGEFIEYLRSNSATEEELCGITVLSSEIDKQSITMFYGDEDYLTLKNDPEAKDFIFRYMRDHCK